MSSPSSTDSVSRALDDIRQSLDVGRLAHAYLIAGDPRGAAGDIATRIVQLVFCEDPARPCGQCSCCRRIAERRHPDVTLTEPRSKSRQILADEIRELNVRISRTSFEGGWKAGVVLHADRMNAAAANAFLKTLEEPPPRSLLLLVSDEAHSLMPTLLSRCQRINVHSGDGLPHAPWMPRLRELLAEGAPGSVIDALGRAAQFSAVVEGVIAEIEEYEKDSSPDSEESDDVLKARVSARTKEIERHMFRAILFWHRDVAMARADPDTPFLMYRDDQNVIRNQAGALTLHAAMHNVTLVEHALLQRERNFRIRTAFEHMLIDIGRSAKEKV